MPTAQSAHLTKDVCPSHRFRLPILLTRYGDDAFGAESAVIDRLCRTLSTLLDIPSTSTPSQLSTFVDAQPEVMRARVREPESLRRPRVMPRVLLAHEHRSRDAGLPWLREELRTWDDGDEHLVLHIAHRQPDPALIVSLTLISTLSFSHPLSPSNRHTHPGELGRGRT